MKSLSFSFAGAVLASFLAVLSGCAGGAEEGTGQGSDSIIESAQLGGGVDRDVAMGERTAIALDNVLDQNKMKAAAVKVQPAIENPPIDVAIEKGGVTPKQINAYAEIEPNRQPEVALSGTMDIVTEKEITPKRPSRSIKNGIDWAVELNDGTPTLNTAVEADLP